MMFYPRSPIAMASTKAHTERCRRKLGLATWDGDEESADMVRWTQLMQLMARSEADWTIFFRSLVSSTYIDALFGLGLSFYLDFIDILV